MKEMSRLKATSTGFNFINVLLTNFLYKCRLSSFFYLHVARKKLPQHSSHRKRMIIMLMKLTAGFGAVFAWFRGFTSLGGLTQARDTDNRISR